MVFCIIPFHWLANFTTNCIHFSLFGQLFQFRNIKPIERKITQKELTQKIKDLEKELKVLERLKFINYRYQGKSVDEAVALIGVTKRVGYIWQERWNKEGIEGLKPRYKGGKQSKISSEQLEELKKYLIKNNITNTKEIKQIIEDEYQVNFSEKHVRTLIHKMNLK